MIKVKQKGNFSKTDQYLKKAKKASKIRDLDKYGKEGVAALSSATPVKTGLTAKSWKYEIVKEKGKVGIYFSNSNIQNGIPIAIIIQHGHATGNGGWVEGRDYINPAIQPIFDKIADSVWKEVTGL